MAFSVPNANRRLVSSAYSDGKFSRIGRVGSVSDFVSSFGGRVVSPRFGINPTLNIHIGSSSSRNGSGDSNGDGDSSKKRGKSGSRPHKSLIYRPYSQRGATNLTYNSGLDSGLSINKLQKNTSSYSTCFVCAGSFFPRLKNQPYSQKLVNRNIYSDYLMKCQTSTNPSIDRRFTSDKFYEYISCLVAGLQLYYYVDSIVAYGENTDNVNKNDGLACLRNDFTAEVLSYHQLLSETLCKMICPSNLLDTIRYMYQNFAVTDAPDSSIIRLSFREVAHKGKHLPLSSDYYSVIINELRDSADIVNAVLEKSFPNSKINSLPLSSSVPIHDLNFITFWVNNSISYLSVDKVIHTRTVKDNEQLFNYFSFNGEDLDGLFAACLSIYSHESDSYENGIWFPISDVTKFKGFDQDSLSSLLCYDSSLDKFITPKSLSSLSLSGLYHGVYYNVETKDLTEALMPPIGSVKMSATSIASFAKAVSLSIFYLYDID
jgi:hypothetical protein